MYDAQLAYHIKKLLQKYTSKVLKINDIEKNIHIGKHKKKDLRDTLRIMIREKVLFYNNKGYSLIEEKQLEYIQGRFDARSLAKNRSYAFVITEKEDIYISSEDTSNAYHDDLVEVEIRYTRFHKKYGVITRILERNRDTFIGNCEQYGQKTYLIPDNSRIHTNFEIGNLQQARPGDKVIIKITNWGVKSRNIVPAGDVVEVLGRAGDPEIEILSVIRHYDLPLEFPSHVLPELEKISPEITAEDISDRRDLRELPTLTIDPASARDFDDAISLETLQDGGYRLYVHIADVAHYIKPESALFQEAVNRGNSYYFPKMVIPMLPEKLSNLVCSLRPYEDKLTVTVVTEYDTNCNITSQEAFESVIKSAARLNYEEVDILFDGGATSIPEDIAVTLKQMRVLSQTLNRVRLARGYLQLNLPETEFIFDDEGHITDLARSAETDSHALIENFMLVANEYVARQLGKQSTLYRIHEQPDPDRIDYIEEILQIYGVKYNKNSNLNKLVQNMLQALPDANYHRVFDHMILRSMKRARYSIQNSGHFGLALVDYTHFTSPIRRLCDLVVHHQLKNLLHSQESPFLGQVLFRYAGIATEREQIADESEREVELKNKLIFMRKQLGMDFTGIIVAVRPNSLVVELDRYPVTGVVTLASMKEDYYEYLDPYQQLVGRKKGKIYKLTDKVKVMVSQVSDDIYFQIVN